MTALQIARLVLSTIDAGAKALEMVNIHPVATLAAGAIEGLVEVAISGIDNASKSEAEALAALKVALLKSVAAVDLHLGDLEDARRKADAAIAGAAPTE